MILIILLRTWQTIVFFIYSQVKKKNVFKNNFPVLYCGHDECET